MSTAPRPASILGLYDWHRNGKLLVNRRYQRKLVWTTEEKQKLIDSILSNYPLPLILLAGDDTSGYEIIDGMQRLNAVFSFIETGYPLKDKRYFDLNVFPSAKQAGTDGLFQPKEEPFDKLPHTGCLNLLEYQMAVTVFSNQDEKQINEIFSRINSSGRQLSNQEKRQSGVVSDFADLVRDISCEIRGDVSRKKLKLHEMPMISIETKRDIQGYSINAEDTFWCRHGILSTKLLKESEDEDLLTDILASILLEYPLARSKELLDSMYDPKEKITTKIKNELRKIKIEYFKEQIRGLFSHIDTAVRQYSSQPKALRKTVMGEKSTASSMKTPFYSIFMAFYELMIKENKIPSPEKTNQLIKSLYKLNERLEIQTHHATTDQRKNNINAVKGLIGDYFVRKEPSQLLHGPGLVLDFENSLRRSKIETPRYEIKQGLLSLGPDRALDINLIKKLAQTVCGIANVGPESRGFVHIGVADKKEHADKIRELDNMKPVQVNSHWVVGVDREAHLQGKTLEGYVNLFVSEFQKTKLSEHLKSSVLNHIDIINYMGLSVIRISIMAQKKHSFVGEECFIREGSHTKPIPPLQVEEVIGRFKL